MAKLEPIIDLGSPVKHLLVDLDGTLLGNRNIPLSISFVRRALFALKKHGSIGKSLRALLAVNQEFRHPSNPEFTNDQRAIASFAQHMNISYEEGKEILREAVSLIFPQLQRHFYPIPGAMDFLSWAREHYPLTLATNPVWPSDIVELRLRWAGVDPKIFSFITDVRKMHACKPLPEYYGEILHYQGLQPEDCLLIGDGMKMDLPATRVGIRVFIVGPFKEVTPLKLAGAKVQAWKGTYSDLKLALQTKLS